MICGLSTLCVIILHTDFLFLSWALKICLFRMFHSLFSWQCKQSHILVSLIECLLISSKLCMCCALMLSFQIWCGKMRDEEALHKIRTAVHSPGPLRILGPLSNSLDFAEAYSCPVGSRMNPTKKCSVWWFQCEIHPWWWPSFKVTPNSSQAKIKVQENQLCFLRDSLVVTAADVSLLWNSRFLNNSVHFHAELKLHSICIQTAIYWSQILMTFFLHG